MLHNLQAAKGGMKNGEVIIIIIIIIIVARS
jgi:hypothetical protein